MAPRSSSKKASSKVAAHKFDHTEHFRPEIEERTALGETSEQIAAALRAKGVDITSKTISRRRVEWGLRQRPAHKLSGTKAAKPRARRPDTQTAAAHARKAEIETRTQHGQTAEQIAEAMIAQGWTLNRGASTVLRLQTFWGLVPNDEARPKRRKKSDNPEPRVKKVKEPKVSKREQEREANREQQNSTMHYPTNCNFGPKKRGDGAVIDDDIDMPADTGMDSGFMLEDASVSPQPAQQEEIGIGHNVAAEVMSVEILVDLASSTLSAAHNLKDMLLAYQGHRPVPNSVSGLPPSLNDLATARKKVREAAGIMLDLAADPQLQVGVE